MEQVVLCRIDLYRFAQQIACHVEQVDDLFKQLTAALAAVPPPPAMQRIAGVAPAHEGGSALVADLVSEPLYGLSVPEHEPNLAFYAAGLHRIRHVQRALHRERNGFLNQKVDAMLAGQIDLITMREGR